MHSPEFAPWLARQTRIGLALSAVVLGLSVTLLAPTTAEAGPLNPKPGPTYAPDLVASIRLLVLPTPLARTAFTASVKNQGSSEALGVRVNTTLPDGFTNIDVSANGNPCAVSGHTATCTFVRIAAGSEVKIDVGANAPALTGPYAVTVVVDPQNVVKESRETNNTAIATINVY